MEVGLFGGTFNPIHLGHLRAAEEVCQALGLDRLLFIPSNRPPHKDPGCVADSAHRLELVRAAIAGNPLFEVSEVELDREGKSFSIETIRQLKDGEGASWRIWFIVGADAFGEMDTWYRYREIFEEADIAVMRRPPCNDLPPPPPGMAEILTPDGEGYIHPSGHRVRFIPMTPLDISSTAIREALKEGRSIRYLVPEPVREILEKSCVSGHGEKNES